MARRFEQNGRPGLAYDDLGDRDAPPVVLLAGGASGSRDGWGDIPQRLASRFRVLALDLRGHGDSDHADGAYRIEDYAADVEGFIEQVVGRPTAIVGHSLGGVVAAQVAGTRPDLVSKVFFEDAPLNWKSPVPEPSGPGFDPDAFRAEVRSRLDAGASAGDLWTLGLKVGREFGSFHAPHQAWVKEVCSSGATIDEVTQDVLRSPSPLGGLMSDHVTAEFVQSLIDGWRRSDPAVLTPEKDWLAAYDRTRPIPCPVFMLRGDPSLGPSPVGGAFLPHHAERFLETHPNATVKLAEGAGHGIHLEKPDLFYAELAAFLA